jgi:GTP-binding protein
VEVTQAQVVRSERPAVAIVGRPNVGKSTLFNRLVGRRQAIVHDLPGVTRDRLIERCEIADGFEIDLIDTGGLVPDREDEIGLNQQVVAAIEESDLVIMVVDGRSGPLPADREILDTLRRSRRPVTLAVNKADTREAGFNVHEFHAFGLEPILVSAEHGTGIQELRDAVAGLAPHVAEHEVSEGVGVAIVGRPNVGKSSLLNRLVGDERVLVSPIAGTTRDPIDTVLEWQGETYVLVDTAGIRRRSRGPGRDDGASSDRARRVGAARGRRVDRRHERRPRDRRRRLGGGARAGTCGEQVGSSRRDGA